MSIKKRFTSLFSSEASVFRQFADHYDMVYFGRMHHDDDEQRMVRGVTVSAQHLDEHYCLGTVHNYDTVLMKRTDSLSQPGSNAVEKYTWYIMQFDLRSKYRHDHVFLDGGHHDEVFYNTLFIKFARMTRIEKSLFRESSMFKQKFSAYTPPDSIDEVLAILDAKTAETIAHHFAHLDFEWSQDVLIVYSTGRMPTKQLLEHMLRAGLWLAEVLDTYGKKQTTAHGEAAVKLEQ